MKNKFFISALFLLIINIGISQTLQNIVNQTTNTLNSGSTGNNNSNPLTNDQVVKGLKEALSIGTNNSTGLASKLDGFYKNPALFIPFKILKGGNNAATEFLKNKTTAELTQKFTPIVKAAIDKVQLTKYWNPLITKYNKIPLVQKQNPNLTAYVTQRALKGLFKLIADEELKIRTNPAAQVTSLLQSVFGSLLH